MPVDKTSSSVVAPLRSRNAPLEPERPTPSKPATSASTAWQPTTAKLVRNEALFLEREGHFFGQPELASLEDAARNGDPAGRKSILGAVPADGVVDADDQREMALSLLEQLGGRQTPVFGIEAFQQKYGSVFADASVSEKYPELPEHRGVHALGEVDTFDGRKQLFAGEYLDPSTKAMRVAVFEKVNGQLQVYPKPSAPPKPDTALDTAIEVAAAPIAVVWTLLNLIGLGVSGAVAR